MKKFIIKVINIIEATVKDKIYLVMLMAVINIVHKSIIYNALITDMLHTNKTLSYNIVS